MIFHQSVLELLECKPTILESSQYSKLVLLLPWWISRSQCFCEESRAPCFANAYSSTVLIVSSSIRRIGKNNFPLPLGRTNGSLCEPRTLGWDAEGARTSFLVARKTSNMGCTSFLDACLDCAKQDFRPPDFWSSESNSALDLRSALGIWTASTNRLFPWEIMT